MTSPGTKLSETVIGGLLLIPALTALPIHDIDGRRSVFLSGETEKLATLCR